MKRNSLKIVVGVITLCAALIFIGTLVRALWYAPDTEVLVPDLHAELKEYPADDFPGRLQIPSLNIDTNVQHVGVNARGNMANPNNFTDVGWYKYGPPPGYRGSSVMAGHVDNGLKLRGVFKELDHIRIGDDIYVVTKGGIQKHFVVDMIASYPYKNAPAELIFAQKDTARLNLITCNGDWVPREKTYDERLVVYSKFVPN